MRVPPILLLIICFVFATVLAKILPIRSFQVETWVAVTITLSGIAFLLLAVISFARNQTTVNPQSPNNTTKLVTKGVYRITRNPMYVGMILILLAYVLWLGELSAAFTVVIFFFLIDRYQIKLEERVLHNKFGKAFDDYLKIVPKWLFIRTEKIGKY